MKNNEFFREDLLVNYLYLLAKNGEKAEFDMYFPQVEAHLQRTAGIEDKDYLEKVRTIIDFKTKEKTMEM